MRGAVLLALGATDNVERENLKRNLNDESANKKLKLETGQIHNPYGNKEPENKMDDKEIEPPTPNLPASGEKRKREPDTETTNKRKSTEPNPVPDLEEQAKDNCAIRADNLKSEENESTGKEADACKETPLSQVTNKITQVEYTCKNPKQTTELVYDDESDIEYISTNIVKTTAKKQISPAKENCTCRACKRSNCNLCKNCLN